MTIPLGRPSPDASRDRPGRRRESAPGPCGPAAPTWSCSRWGLPCRRRYRRRGALLPHPFTLAARSEAGSAVCFLWHCPWGRPRRALPGTVLPWSPDFPPSARLPERRAAIRPSGALNLGWRRRPVNQGTGTGHQDRRRNRSALTARATAARRAAVSSSRTPSTRAGRNLRWNAIMTWRVSSSSVPEPGAR